MRIRVKKPFYFLRHDRKYLPGEVADIQKEDAEILIKSEIVMEDKSLDGPKEVKTEPKPTATKKTTAKRTRK